MLGQVGPTLSPMSPQVSQKDKTNTPERLHMCTRCPRKGTHMTPPNTSNTTHTTRLLGSQCLSNSVTHTMLYRHRPQILAQLTSLTFLELSTQHTQLGQAECAKQFNNLLALVLSGFRELRRVRRASKSSPRCREIMIFENRALGLLLVRSWGTLRTVLGPQSAQDGPKTPKTVPKRPQKPPRNSQHPVDS